MIDVAAIRRRTDLADLVGRYVQLKDFGREIKGCCPFHDERTPSFFVSKEKGFVHCFGCGVHLDAIGFVMRIMNKSFREACEMLTVDGASCSVALRSVRFRYMQWTIWTQVRGSFLGPL